MVARRKRPSLGRGVKSSRSVVVDSEDSDGESRLRRSGTSHALLKHTDAFFPSQLRSRAHRSRRRRLRARRRARARRRPTTTTFRAARRRAIVRLTTLPRSLTVKLTHRAVRRRRLLRRRPRRGSRQHVRLVRRLSRFLVWLFQQARKEEQGQAAACRSQGEACREADDLLWPRVKQASAQERGKWKRRNRWHQNER